MSYLSNLLGESYKEGMTEEEISAALESAKVGTKEVVDNTADLDKLKSQLSKANAEAADYKKQLRSRQSADEAAAADQKALMDKLTQENTDLKRSIALADKQTKLLSMGYDEKLAAETAAAMVDGDMDTVMKNQTTFIESQKKLIKADAMKNTPRPAAGSDNAGSADGMTLDRFRKLSSKERFAWANENPEEYKAMYSGDTNSGGNE